MEKFELPTTHGWTIVYPEKSQDLDILEATQALGHRLGYYQSLAQCDVRAGFDEAVAWIKSLTRADNGFVFKKGDVELRLVPDFKEGPESALLAIMASVVLSPEELNAAVTEDPDIREASAGNFLNAIAIQDGMWPWEPAQAKH